MPDRRSAGARGQGAVIQACLLAILLGIGAAHAAQAREGIYVTVGAAGQSISGDLERSQRIQRIPGVAMSDELRAGKPDAGNGFAVGGGFGLSRNLTLDLLVVVTRHDALFDEGTGAPLSQEATLTAVLAGIKLVAPLGDVLELFGRIGLGGYELEYDQINFPSSGGAAVDDARFSGRGGALGLGVEVIFDSWGLEFSYTHHRASLDSVDTLNFPSDFDPSLSIAIDTATVLFIYHFQ